MNVVLVKPRNFKIAVSKGTIRLPLGLAYIAAACENKGHNVVIIDSEVLDIDSEALAKEILKYNPDLVGFTATTPLVLEADTISRKIKEAAPEIKTIIGGPHITFMPEETLKITSFDFACIGEGEDLVPTLLEVLREKGDTGKIPGLMSKVNGLIYGSNQSRMTDINTVPLPARHLLDLSKYIDIPRGINEPQDIIFTARGCPEKCAFCISATQKVRARTTESVLSEIDEIVYKYGTKFLSIGDDTFTQHKGKTIELCKTFVERDYKLRYICQTRLDKVDGETLEWLEKSGCYAICMGIESGSNRILNSMNKRNDIEKIRKNIPLIKSFGFNLRATYILGWIDETEDEVWETIKLAQEIDADESAFCIATPFPGTDLWKAAVSRGMTTDLHQLSKFHYYREIGFNTSQITDERLLELQQIAHNTVPSRIYKVCS